MPLVCKIGNREIPLSDIWCDKEDFDNLASDQIRELIEEDLLSFIEEINLLDHCEFYWRSKK